MIWERFWFMGRVAHNRLTLEEIKELYENENFKILNIEHIKKSYGIITYIGYMCLIHNYKGRIALGSLRCGSKCKKCGISIRNVNSILSLEEVKIRLKEINPNIEILSNEYIDSKAKLKCKCLIHNIEFDVNWSHLKQGQSCKICGEFKKSQLRQAPQGNSIHDIRPDLMIFLKDKSDGYNFTVSSGRKIKLKCPHCGKEKNMAVYSLSSKGFSCDYCSDGISIPEKFGIYLFKQLGIEFDIQKNFKWSQRKKYDFYFNNIIIECHGLQHYEYVKRGGRTLQEEQENDSLKYNLAIQNGVKPKNYIIIDCRYSEFEWLKENFVKVLENHFDLSNIDWEEIWKECQSSLLIKICNAWRLKTIEETTVTFENKFKISRTTIVKYLKVGTNLGLCEYNPKEELKRSVSKNGKTLAKITYQYSLTDEFIKSWSSAITVKTTLGISNENISACCHGRNKSAGGFKWSYSPPIDRKSVV
jgi:hypothetical protein